MELQPKIKIRIAIASQQNVLGPRFPTKSNSSESFSVLKRSHSFLEMEESMMYRPQPSFSLSTAYQSWTILRQFVMFVALQTSLADLKFAVLKQYQKLYSGQDLAAGVALHEISGFRDESQCDLDEDFLVGQICEVNGLLVALAEFSENKSEEEPEVIVSMKKTRRNSIVEAKVEEKFTLPQVKESKPASEIPSSFNTSTVVSESESAPAIKGPSRMFTPISTVDDMLMAEAQKIFNSPIMKTLEEIEKDEELTQMPTFKIKAEESDSSESESEPVNMELEVIEGPSVILLPEIESEAESDSESEDESEINVQVERSSNEAESSDESEEEDENEDGIVKSLSLLSDASVQCSSQPEMAKVEIPIKEEIKVEKVVEVHVPVTAAPAPAPAPSKPTFKPKLTLRSKSKVNENSSDDSSSDSESENSDYGVADLFERPMEMPTSPVKPLTVGSVLFEASGVVGDNFSSSSSSLSESDSDEEIVPVKSTTALVTEPVKTLLKVPVSPVVSSSSDDDDNNLMSMTQSSAIPCLTQLKDTLSFSMSQIPSLPTVIVQSHQTKDMQRKRPTTAPKKKAPLNIVTKAEPRKGTAIVIKTEPTKRPDPITEVVIKTVTESMTMPVASKAVSAAVEAVAKNTNNKKAAPKIVPAAANNNNNTVPMGVAPKISFMSSAIKVPLPRQIVPRGNANSTNTKQ